MSDIRKKIWDCIRLSPKANCKWENSAAVNTGGVNSKGNIFWKRDSKKHIICGIIGICISVVLTGVIVRVRADELGERIREGQERLAGEVFRFHVLANSDSERDQEIKLAVRDAVIGYMKDDMGEETSAKAVKEWVKVHLEELEETADEVLADEGVSYRARAEVTSCWFPEKRYGDVTFPEGEYEALRIELGEASGHNWWCVLYPNLCFMDTTCAVVSDEGKEELSAALEEDEYEMIAAASKFKVRWFFFGDKGF